MKRIFTQTRVRLLGLLIFIVGSAQAVQAQQYTLTDNDVVVTDGVIQSCSYDFAIKDIVIPETLDGQTVVGIADKTTWGGVFYNKDIVAVTLPSTIKTIGDFAFFYNKITNIVIPNSIISIGKSAFCNNQLVNVILGSSVTKIRYNAFYNNGNLLVLKLPQPKIADCVFIKWQNGDGKTYEVGSEITDFNNSYTAEVEYTLKDNDVVVVNGIIQSCSYDFAATSIFIPETLDNQIVTGIADKEYTTGVFHDKGMLKICLPNTMQVIGDYAFYANQLTSIVLPNNVSKIGYSTFQKNKLEIVDFPDSVKKIGSYAFLNNQLTKVILGSSVTRIGKSAFSNNSNLSSIALPITALEGYEFIKWVDSKEGEHEGGAEVTDFGVSYTAEIEYTLKDDDVVVTNGVIESCSYDFNATSIIIPETLDGQTVVAISDNVGGDGVFYDKDILKITLPSTLENIGNNAFNRNVLLNIIIPNSVTSIGYAAFCNNHLKSAILSKNINFIGSGAFCSNNLSAITIPDKITHIEDYVFRDNQLTNVVIPNGVASIGYLAFEGNNIESLILPNSVITIEGGAFERNNIEALIIPNSVKIIQYDAFKYNPLTNVTLGNSLIKIGGEAFNSSNKLESIILPIPETDGNTFINWIDESGKTYNGGEEIRDFYTSYVAQFKIKTYLVRFFVYTGNSAFANATVTFDGINYTTNADGVVDIENVIAGNYKYSVSAQGYQTQTGELTVDNQKVSKEISLSKVTAIDNVLSDAIKVYPNPVASTLNIKGSELIGEVTISNVAGVVVYSTKLNANSVSVDVSNLHSGVYILRVFVDKGVIVKRFVKK